MSVFLFQEKDSVLFLGEGNFTFCYTLIKHIKNSHTKKNLNDFYASCLEEEQNSLISDDVKTYLKCSGVNLLFAVNGTKVSQHPLLGKIKFNKIVFNFPHVGGKMKIHLNRQLLEEFFLESSLILSNEGEIIVTLCAGQGGTSEEKVKRRWDDTWQIVEMAARCDLILKETKPFPYELLNTYVSVGYRGRLKSFNTQNAVIHYFRKGIPLSINTIYDASETTMLHLFDGVLMSYTHKRKIQNNPYFDSKSPQCFFTEILEEQCRNIDSDYKTISDAPLYTVNLQCSDQAECVVQGRRCYLRKNLLDIFSKKYNDKHYFIKGVTFNIISDNFTIPAAECHAAVFGPRSMEIFNNFVRKIQFLFQSYLKDSDENMTLLTENNNSFFLNDTERKGINVNIDQILVNIFKTNWRQLWSFGIILKLNGELSTIIPPSVHFQTFRFDISFRCKNGPLDVKKLLILVKQLDLEYIESCYLLNEFKPDSNSFKIIYCFRFVYNSYHSALCKKNALIYHNLIGQIIEKLLHVEVV